MQSFVKNELARTGRKHDAAIVSRDVSLLREYGIGNINLDLIAGLPGQTEASWKESVDGTIALGAPHVSVYMLEVDEDSRLGAEVLLNGVRYGARDVPEENAIADFYETAVEELSRAGIERYEISNFARAGFESRHNLKYWRRQPYIGLGADAHSFDGAVRRQNVESAADYVARSREGRSLVTEETPVARGSGREVLRRPASGQRCRDRRRRLAPPWRSLRALPCRWSYGTRRYESAPDRKRHHGIERNLRGVHRMIDLRSDTVTKPTAAMRRAMAEAEVGDDVYGEDPTLNRLEQRAAEIMGKEAAVFVPTGTMGNVIALKALTEHGEEVICDSRAHTFDWELSMVAWFCGVQLRPVPTERGIMTWEQIEPHFKTGSDHSARTGAVELENTHNMGGGSVYPQATFDRICDEAHARGLNVHLDGARIFNAAEATGTALSRMVERADTVMFCLSKALGAPLGSIVVGAADRITKACLYRKRLGGGMRQVGIVAAAGLIALEETPKRLAEDHTNARAIAARLARMEGIDVRPVETNIVIFDISRTGSTPEQIAAALKQRGVLIGGVYGTIMRAVTHYDVSHADCMTAMDALEEVLVEVLSAKRRNVPDG